MRYVLGLAISMLACSGEPPRQQTVNRDTLTQRQKDSILAQSKIPGARGVGAAMRAADSMSAKIHVTDTAGGP